jgi:hypothetical protein
MPLARSILVTFTLLAAPWTLHAQQSSVPFIGCPSDGQIGPLKAPTGKPKLLSISPEAASQLAWYQAEGETGLLAPRGWRCFSTYGSSGSTLYVAPTLPPHAEFFSESWKGIDGPAIQLSAMDGGTSGRFSVAETIARVFPAYRRFAEKVRAEHLGLDTLPSGPYPADRLHYLSDTIVEYTTPANTDGLGTDSRLRKNASPITGVAILTGYDTACITLSMRLPPALTPLRLVTTRQLIDEAGHSPPPRP